MLERVLVCLLTRRPPPDRGRARAGEDADGQDDRRRCSAARSSAIQFTPDLVPSDLVGTRIFRPDQSDVRDRARPGLLQLPARRRDQPRAGEGAVGAARGDAGAPGDDRPRRPTTCPTRSSCMATQNPIESEGTYPLPEAQVDRFMLKILVDYPLPRRGADVVHRSLVPRAGAARRCCRSTSCARSSRRSTRVYVDPALVSYAVKLAAASRNPAESALDELRRTSSRSARARAARSA